MPSSVTSQIISSRCRKTPQAHATRLTIYDLRHDRALRMVFLLSEEAEKVADAGHGERLAEHVV